MQHFSHPLVPGVGVLLCSQLTFAFSRWFSLFNHQRSLVEWWTPRALWVGMEGARADRSVSALGWDGCGCPPHSPSSWEILSLLPSLSFSFDPCCPWLQEYIRRQLEEEQRQLEILQQQLLQEQALLLVNGRPRPRLPLAARVASACARVHPCPPGCLLPCREVEDTVAASMPAAMAGSPRGACLSPCIPSAASACLCLPERSSPLCCRLIWKAVGSMSERGRAVACLQLAKPTLPCGFSYSEGKLWFSFPHRNAVLHSLSCCLHSSCPLFFI